jgi:pimeloyl-ACP methyl ester carboxylesterase
MRVFKLLFIAAILSLPVLVGLYFIAPAKFFSLAVGLERAIANLERKEIQAGGLRFVYLDSGGKGEPLVLVHGFGGDKDNWTRMARHLTPHYRVMIPDLPGYGESSSPPDADYRIADGVTRLHDFVAALGLRRAHFGGNSMGGHIVAAYAAQYPNEVGSLWLIANAGVLSAPQSELRARIARGEANVLAASTPEQYRALMGFVMSRPPPIPDRLLDVMAAKAVAVSALRARQFAQIVDPPVAVEGVIQGLPIPVHILWGDQDRLLHVGAVEILRGLLPQSSSTILPGIGHVPMIEAPEESARDYLAFREKLRAIP